MDQFNMEKNNTVQNNTIQTDTIQNDTIQNGTPQYDPEQGGLPAKKIVSRAGFALFIMTVVVLSVQTLIELLVKRFYPALANTDWYLWAVTAISLIVIGFPAYALMIRRAPNSPRKQMVKLKPSHFFVIFFICVAAMYITNFFSVILTLGIALIKGEELINPVAEAILNGNFIITLIYAAVVAPIFEELIFRKLLLDKLRRFGDLPAILMTGIAFGLFHMNLSQFFYAAVLGFIFAYVVIRTNTVIYSILLHMMINFIATVMTPFATEENLIAIMIIFLWMIISITIGVVLFILNVKKIKLEKAAPLMKKSDYFFYLGTILYTLICLVVIVIYTIG